MHACLPLEVVHPTIRGGGLPVLFGEEVDFAVLEFILRQSNHGSELGPGAFEHLQHL